MKRLDFLLLALASCMTCITSRSDRAIAGLSMGGAVTGNGTVETPAHLID
jgi:hypothetical protein